jgi:hypothetical protein
MLNDVERKFLTLWLIKYGKAETNFRKDNALHTMYMSYGTMTLHMKRLIRYGMIKETQYDTWVYSLTDKALEELNEPPTPEPF